MVAGLLEWRGATLERTQAYHRLDEKESRLVSFYERAMCSSVRKMPSSTRNGMPRCWIRSATIGQGDAVAGRPVIVDRDEKSCLPISATRRQSRNPLCALNTACGA